MKLPSNKAHCLRLGERKALARASHRPTTEISLLIQAGIKVVIQLARLDCLRYDKLLLSHRQDSLI